MSLEIAVKIRLVGEIEVAHKLLKIFVRIHQRYLQFNYSMVVYNLLCILSACPLTYRVELAGGYLQTVGIKLHRAVLTEFFSKQYAELIEHFVFALGYMFFCSEVCLFIYVLYV